MVCELSISRDSSLEVDRFFFLRTAVFQVTVLSKLTLRALVPLQYVFLAQVQVSRVILWALWLVSRQKFSTITILFFIFLLGTTCGDGALCASPTRSLVASW